MNKINKNKIVSSSFKSVSESGDISEMHQEEELFTNSGTETDLRKINQTEARCNGEKAQETPKKNFLQENQNCDEITVERKYKKKRYHNAGGRAH